MASKKSAGAEAGESASVGVGEFLRGVRAESQKVTWPTWKDTRSATVVVLIFTAVSGLFLGSVDFLFSKLIELLVR